MTLSDMLIIAEEKSTSKLLFNYSFRLRKIYKLTQEKKKKFTKVIVNPQNIVDSKTLLIPVLDIERKWAQGMSLRQELTNVGREIKKLRYSIKKKFSKVAQQAESLNALCQIVGNSQTKLESEAYFLSLNANLLLTKRKFNEALDCLKKSQKIYEMLYQLKDTIEAIPYREKINSLQASIRLCLYNLNLMNEVFCICLIIF